MDAFLKKFCLNREKNGFSEKSVQTSIFFIKIISGIDFYGNFISLKGSKNIVFRPDLKVKLPLLELERRKELEDFNWRDGAHDFDSTWTALSFCHFPAVCEAGKRPQIDNWQPHSSFAIALPSIIVFEATKPKAAFIAWQMDDSNAPYPHQIGSLI